MIIGLMDRFCNKLNLFKFATVYGKYEVMFLKSRVKL